MLQLTPHQNIYIANSFVDFRKGIDGLAASVRNLLQLNPLTGAIFVFYNRTLTSIKLLTFDGQGFWLHTKRLSQGKFKYNFSNTNPYLTVCHRSLYILIHNGDPKSANLSKDWLPIKPHA
jgi:transposase